MIKIQAFIIAFSLLILGYSVMAFGDNSHSTGYYLTVGEQGVSEITYTTLGGSNYEPVQKKWNGFYEEG